MKTLRLQLCALFVLGLIGQAQETAVLPIEQRTNGAATLDALSMIQSAAKRSVAQVLDANGKPVQLAVLVSEDGYVLTKASEAPDHEELTLVWFDGSQSIATVVIVDRAFDLLLARTSVTSAVPIVWSQAKDWRRGTWMCAFNQGKENSPSLPLRLGNISAARREVRGHGAAMGIEMANDTGTEGVCVVDFGADSPAQKAGLQVNDVIRAIDDTTVTSLDMIHVEMEHKQPGDRVKLSLWRDRKECHVVVHLASRSKVVSNWTGEDYANGGVSLRTDNFPNVLQHQMPLSPRDMGGPLLDLEGKAVGINIARVDRVTTFALPVATFWGRVQQWIVQDRKAAGEEVRAAEVIGGQN